MPDIKTRAVAEKMVKTLDKSAIAAQRMKNAYYGQDVPLSATCTPIENRGMIFTDDKGREFRFEQGGLN
ncbi:MAG: NAD(P)/FAD-dependent oxidoreductase, partial [Oscillospiraceae bacterium]|nr:NAD(P)/FAD-dependent oxidoreductase [Oscillospiraceae bacterium]